MMCQIVKLSNLARIEHAFIIYYYLQKHNFITVGEKMSDKLSEHIEALRRELDKLIGAFVADHSAAMDSLMIKLDGMKREIDALDAFVVQRGDKRCQAMLRKKMGMYMNTAETKTLILDMGISDFDIEISSLSNFHGELIGYCERREILPDLVSVLKSHRPRVKWPDC